MTEHSMTPRLRGDEPSPKTRLRHAPAIERLMFRTALVESGCWIWRGSTNPKGYGHIRRDMDGPVCSVHRLSFEHFNGPVPEGLEVDHLCFNRACVNPDHLEAVTRGENVHRGRHNQNHGKAECINGHPFDATNTSTDSLGKRVCKTCSRERTRAYRARKAAA